MNDAFPFEEPSDVGSFLPNWGFIDHSPENWWTEDFNGLIYEVTF